MKPPKSDDTWYEKVSLPRLGIPEFVYRPIVCTQVN